MKLKSLLFVCLMGLFAVASAGNRHVPVYNEQAMSKVATKGAVKAGPCQIEIINRSDSTLQVNGEVTDGYGIIGIVDPFKMKPYDFPHTIELGGAYGYCPAGMYVHILKLGFFFDTMVYDRFVYPGTSIYVP